MGATADLVRRWVELYNDGSPEAYGSDDFLRLYAADVDWKESPTSLTPEGRGGDLRTLREATAFGRSLFRNRRVAIDVIVEEGDRAVWTGAWSATIGVDGLPSPRGTVVEIAMAMLVEVCDGRIVRQRDFLTAPVER
ncbi:MAG: nuclear transport factor 2 family protein [bacterium]|nr:nuclear transport factor 2 family protein [bacterium]